MAQRTVTDIVGEESKSPQVYQLCISYGRSLLTTYRTEERRKILAKHPYEEYNSLSNNEMATRSMKAEMVPATIELYKKHVALLRKFIDEERENATISGCMFKNFLRVLFKKQKQIGITY